MNSFKTIALTQAYLDKARIADLNKNPDEVITQLIKIRDLLNERPEIEAGGTTRRCRACNRASRDLFITGDTWTEPDLCSKCK